MESPEQDSQTAEKRILNAMFHLFFFLYGLAPVLIVPFCAYLYENWVLLFGILFSYAGTFFAARGRFLVFLFGTFMIGFWLKNGFDTHHYLTFYFLCCLWGFFMFLWADAYDMERRKGTSDSDEERFMRYANEIAPGIAQRIREEKTKKDEPQ